MKLAGRRQENPRQGRPAGQSGDAKETYEGKIEKIMAQVQNRNGNRDEGRDGPEAS